MQKLFLLILLFSTVYFKSFAQQGTTATLSAKDSSEIMKELMSALSGDDNPSYFTVSAGIGNRLFSIRNNALNSKQVSENNIIYSPSLAYVHKSGLAISVGANLMNDTTYGFGVNQYSVSPSYQLQDNKYIDFTLAYTHFFVKNKFSSYASPIQNDFYTAIAFKKAWLKPGIAFDYSTGDFREEKRQGRYYDSTTSNLKSFGLIASVAHDFTWDKIFGEDDGILFTPSLMLNAGSSQIAIHHKTNATNLAQFLSKKGKLPKFQNNKFEAESTGLDLDASYVTGKFTIEPEIYFDYYLPATDVGRFTSIFMLTLGYRF